MMPRSNSLGSAVAVRQEPTVHAFPETGQMLRTVTVDGELWFNELWFNALDAGAILGLGNVRSSLALLDDDEKGVHTMDTPGGVQRLAIVSEPGLYSLIMRSRKPEAKAFKRWVTHEVLPSIRRTGAYAVGTMTPREVAKLVIAEADRADTAEIRAAELAPAAEAWGVLAEATGDYSLRDAAHILNRDPAVSTGQNRLLRFLRDEGLVDRKGIPYVRYSRYLVERLVSYTHPHSGEPVLKSQVRITVDGLGYLRKRLGGISRPGNSPEAA